MQREKCPNNTCLAFLKSFLVLHNVDSIGCYKVHHDKHKEIIRGQVLDLFYVILGYSIFSMVISN